MLESFMKCLSKDSQPEIIFEKLEQLAFICGDLVCIPKDKFYELLMVYCE